MGYRSDSIAILHDMGSLSTKVSSVALRRWVSNLVFFPDFEGSSL